MIDQFILAGMTAAFTGGVAWGGFRISMNGTKKRLNFLETQEHQHTERLTRVETKIDILLERN